MPLDRAFAWLADLWQAVRPHQWVKNVFLIAGLIFTGNIVDIRLVTSVGLAILVFCLLSAAAYLLNDIADIERDRLHPHKRSRPIASGRITPRAAFAAAFVLLILAGLLTAAFNPGNQFALLAAAYFLLTSIYSLFLKSLVIVDVITIAAGFLIRVVAGCVVINVHISSWIILCSFLLALFLALSKRRYELLLLGEDSGRHRDVLDMYNLEMVDHMVSISMSTVIMAYSLYTFYSGHSRWMMATIPSVIYGLFRYLYLAHRQDMGGTPEQMFHDKPMIVNFILWSIISVIVILMVGG